MKRLSNFSYLWCRGDFGNKLTMKMPCPKQQFLLFAENQTAYFYSGGFNSRSSLCNHVSKCSRTYEKSIAIVLNSLLESLSLGKMNIIAPKRSYSSLVCHSSIRTQVLKTPLQSSHNNSSSISSSASSSSSSFLKNQPPLLVKRPSRKKIPKIYDEGKVLNNLI